MRNGRLNGKLFQRFLQFGALFITLAGVAAHLSWTKSPAAARHASREMHLSYAFAVKNIPSEANRVDIWAPVPQSDARQSISNLKVECDYPYSFETEPEYGNSILKVEASGSIPESLSVVMNFSVTRTGYHLLQENDQPSETASEKTRQRFLAPDRLVPIDGKIAGEAKKVVRDDMTPLEKARAIYDHVAETVTYDKTPTNRGWGRGDAIYACDVRTGNCTDFHSLLIGMARASGIPARFVMGFPVPEGVTESEIPGYHCWAEFYIEGMGWLPIDASEASKYPEKWNDLFGGLDPHRVQFTVGRDIRVPSMSQSEPLNYFIYPYVLVDGKPHDEVQRHIRFSE
ncbi:transglutaminase-like domain-containing protein [candidate division KSB1 bacterium]|nr:transglutaminase-like domain-containing protein [candidate division KSB1 bacterium]